MNDYELGRDVQVLRSRIERLEAVCDGHWPETGRRHEGICAPDKVGAGVARHQEPRLWKPDKAMPLPPFLYPLLGVPERLTQFDVMPESKTWMCQPEPLVLFVNWNAGGSDEFYRLQNQLFSVIRITEPNSGHISCTATYSARLVASGKARTHYFPATSSLTGYLPTSQFNITLRDAHGGSFGGVYVSLGYSIACQDNHEFVHYFDFNAGLYDLVAGATWEVTGAQAVDRC